MRGLEVDLSHYKRRVIKSSDTNVSFSTKSNDEVLVFGRKELQHKQIIRRDEEHNEHETEDDESDENEKVKFDKEGDSLDDIEEKYGFSKTENEDTSEDNDQDEVDSKVHEAREEHYKADDASSAVTHEESGHYSKSTNISEIVESQTFLKLNESTTNDIEKIQPDPINSTDFIRLEDMDTFDNIEDTVAE
nr:cilia- and flagella-associated protein 251 [Tanacetum cinerariifolium]